MFFTQHQLPIDWKPFSLASSLLFAAASRAFVDRMRRNIYKKNPSINGTRMNKNEGKENNENARKSFRFNLNNFKPWNQSPFITAINTRAGSHFSVCLLLYLLKIFLVFAQNIFLTRAFVLWTDSNHKVISTCSEKLPLTAREFFPAHRHHRMISFQSFSFVEILR